MYLFKRSLSCGVENGLEGVREAAEGREDVPDQVVALGGGQGQTQGVAEACSDGVGVDGVGVEVREEGIQDDPSVVAQTGWMMGTFIKMGRLGLWGR